MPHLINEEKPSSTSPPSQHLPSCHLSLIRRNQNFARVLLAFLLIPILVRGTPRFDIESGDAAVTLKQVAKQAKLSVVYAPRVVDGVQTNAVHGEMTPTEALRRMIAGTPLTLTQETQTGAFAITRPPQAPPATTPTSHDATPFHPTLEKTNEPTNMNMKSPRLRKFFSVFLTLAAAGHGQETPAESSQTDEVLSLSPFQVDASQDSGYLATTTLAGTRIRTNIKDVGASISVITKEFLDDTASTDVEDLLVYVANAEVSGPGGNFSNASVGDGVDTSSTMRAVSTPTRIRGLDGADLTRDFYLTDIPFDTYNTDRITVNRGPNAALFGLGSPAGIINNTLIKPTFNDNTKIGYSYGRFGSQRANLDLDRVLIPDVLAVRISTLYEDERFQQHPAWERDERIFAAFTWQNKLFKDSSVLGTTTVRGNFEIGENRSNRPRISPPGDTVTPWWTVANKGTVPHTLDWRDTNRNLFSVPGLWNFHLGVVFPDETTSNLGGNGAPDAFVPITPANLNSSNFLAGFRGLATFQDYAAGRAGWPGQVENGQFFRDVQMTDDSIFDFRNLLLDGPMKSEFADFETYNIAIEQLFFNGDGGIELSLDNQRVENGWYQELNGIDAYSIQMDVNPNYPDGSVNPNFGRPFVATQAAIDERTNRRESKRFMGFYELDLAEKIDGRWGDVLGRHTFTGLYNSQRIDRFSANFRAATPDQSFLNRMGVSSINSSTFSSVSRVHYLGPSLANAGSPTGADIPNIMTRQEYPASVANGLFWDPATQSWVTEPIKLLTYERDRENVVSGASKTADEVDSYTLIWQSHLLNNLLVGTAGWRTDEAQSFIAPLAPRDPVDNHVLLDDPRFVVNSTPLGVEKRDTFSWSVVLNTPRFIRERLPFNSDLSLSYNESENFEPAAARFNIIGDPLDSPTGTTKDFGLTWSMFDNKFVTRVNFYESEQANISASGAPTGSFITVAREAWQAIANGVNDGNPEVASYRLPPQEILDFWGWQETIQPNGSVAISTSPRGSIAAITSRKSKGVELELVYNPLPNWRLAFNASQQKAVQDGLDAGITAMLAERASVWAATGSLLDPARNFTMQALRNTTIFNPWNRLFLANGAPVQELREWRWNFITNYQFKGDSFMPKGLSVGGALRWQDQVAIGYPVIFSDLVSDNVLDVNNPIMGPTELNGDVWMSYGRMIWSDKVEWTAKINVRNVIGTDDLIPIVAQPDGSLAGVRIPQPMIWELAMGFEF